MEHNSNVIKRKIEKYIISLSVKSETNNSKTYIDFKKLQEYCDKLNTSITSDTIDNNSALWIIK